MDVSGHDSNWECFSRIFEEKMEAVVHLVVVSLAIESTDVSRCNMASSRKLGKPIESNKHERGSQRDGENTLEEDGDANVPDFIFASIVLNNQLSFSTNTTDLLDRKQLDIQI